MTTTLSIDKNLKIRYAVVGLGAFAQSDALPAFAEAKNSELVALVSGDPTKRTELAQKYGVRRTYGYEDYDELLSSGNIDAVYLSLPNHLHCDYTIRAANAGIHVLCEKPMAVTVIECDRMIAAAREHHVKLMIAYRLHLEPANLQAVEIATFTCSFGAVRTETYQVVGTKGDLRVDLAYSTQGPIKHILNIDGSRQEYSFKPHNQVVAEFSYFSDCILNDKEPEPSGTEGLTDVRIIHALYRSIETGCFVQLDEIYVRQLPVAA